MPSAVVAELLAEIDPLAYPERMRRLAGRARALSGSDDVTSVLDDLYRGDRFQREIAVFMAIVAGHQPTIAAAVGDPDWAIHRSAVSAWLRSGPATVDQIAPFLTGASWRTRRHVYRLLRRISRPGIADDLIEVVWDRFGDDEAARLLSACSAGTVARLLPELEHVVNDWPLLGERFPEVVLDAAERRLAGLAAVDRDRWWAWFGAGVIAAAPAVPHRVLDLLERYAPQASLPGEVHRYTALATADSGRLVALMAAPGRAAWLARTALPRSLLRCLATLDTAALAPVARRLRERDRALVALLNAVPPSRRAAVYDAAYADMDRSQSRPSDQILDVLPRARRWAEARRVLSLESVRANAALTLHYTAFLPWDQAKASLTEATRRALADDRAAAYELLLACAARSADAGVVTEVVGDLRRLRNEQDPVRRRALSGLTRVSPRLLQPETAGALEQIAGDALAARDTSTPTLEALTRLAVTVLRGHAGSPPLTAWALGTLTVAFGNRSPVLGRIDTQLRRGQEAELFKAVQSWLEAGMRRGSCDPLFAVARALHRRAWRLPQLQDMLRRAIDGGQTSAVMRQAIALWLADPATRSQRVEHVLATDSSAVTLNEVWKAVGHRRTDLLDVVLTGEQPRGKFVAEGVRWVPLPAPGPRRWLPRQQAAYAGLLAGVAADAGAEIHSRAAAIAAAAAIPDAGWNIVQRYICSASTNLAEAALTALARTSRPGEALSILVEQAGDDRARVAVYAAGRAARFIPPGQLSPVLTQGPLASGKVTSRKEALRLSATLSIPGAGAILRRAWGEEGQHRDIRAAIVSAARQRLHDPESWVILQEAATGGPEEALAVAVLADPFRCAPRYRRRYGELIALTCGSDDEQVARTAWAALPRWAPWIPGPTTLVTAKLTDLDDRSRWRLALPALAALLEAGQSGSLLRDVTSRLADLDLAGPDRDDPGRDRPARQRLRAVVDRAARWADGAAPELDRTPLTDAGRDLSPRPDLLDAAAGLLLAAVRLGRDDARQLAGELTGICDLLVDHPVTASRMANALARRVAAEPGAPPGAIRTAAGLLGEDGRLSAGLFAVALARYGARLGWPAAWREEIRRLRAHSLAEVRTAALETVMAAE
jgi:hypothetical protein